MLSADAEAALSSLADLIARPELEAAIVRRFRKRAGREPKESDVPGLSPELAKACDVLAAELAPLTLEAGGVAALKSLLDGPAGLVLVAFAHGSSWRRDVSLDALLAKARKNPMLADATLRAVRDRVIEGPIGDALSCAPLLGDGAALVLPVNAQARARLEILIWEAGASALEVPVLGAWLWGSPATFAEMIAKPAHGTLRGRVLAARCLEVSVRGMSPHVDPQLIGRTLQVLQPLLLHPEPMVWVHAARALGRLTGQLEQLEGTLLDWVLGESTVLRQRAVTAGAERLR
jgi:serine/threonine-protein kinase